MNPPTEEIPVERWSTPSQRRSVQVGSLTVTYLPDGAVELHPSRWFGLETTEELLTDRSLLTTAGYLAGSIGSFLVSGPDVSVLIDSGFGPRHISAADSHPAIGAIFGGGLALAGVPRLDAVAFTHLHEDHVGWLSAAASPLLETLMAAPRYASRAELDAHQVAGASGWRPTVDGQEIAPGVRALHSPGHTRGHSSYLVESDGESLLCFGDVMHSPLQIRHAHLGSCVEEDVDASLVSRRETIERLLQPGTIGAGVHFADVVFGTVRTTATGHEWVPVP